METWIKRIDSASVFLGKQESEEFILPQFSYIGKHESGILILFQFS